jgi:hypothetical protein
MDFWEIFLPKQKNIKTVNFLKLPFYVFLVWVGKDPKSHIFELRNHLFSLRDSSFVKKTYAYKYDLDVVKSSKVVWMSEENLSVLHAIAFLRNANRYREEIIDMIFLFQIFKMWTKKKLDLHQPSIFALGIEREEP